MTSSSEALVSGRSNYRRCSGSQRCSPLLLTVFEKRDSGSYGELCDKPIKDLSDGNWKEREDGEKFLVVNTFSH